MTNIEPKIPKKYLAIWRLAVPYLEKAREGDLNHTKKVVNEAYIQGEELGLDMEFLIPAAIFHDIGHASILSRHFWMVTGPKKLKGSKLVHMLTGAKIAYDVLTKIKFDKKGTDKIVDFISVHDSKDEKIFSTMEMKTLNDIDKLSRFEKDGFLEVIADFNLKPQEAIEILKKEVLPKIILDRNKEQAKRYLIKLENKYNKK